MTIAGGRTESEVQFSDEIRKASWESHESAEQSPFMGALFGGSLERSRFADFTAQQYFVYEVLEEAAASLKDDPVAGPFVKPELTRLPALEHDLACLLGPSWREKATPTAATQEYCARVREVCFTWPGGFVAHHYVRYMGDLSGGQQIRRVLERKYEIDESNGASFFSFDDISDLGEFKDGYRARLNSAQWDAEERARIIDEVLLAYRFNIQLLDSV